jgi:hypothetical protein
MPEPEFDDIDALFAQTGMVDPPDDLVRRIMLLAHSEGATKKPAMRPASILWVAAYALALAGLAILAYALGMAFAATGTPSLLSALVTDSTLLSDAPSAYIEALLSSLPWLHIAAVLIDLALLGAITWFALHLASPGKSGWRPSTPA